MAFSIQVENIKCGGCANSIKTKLMQIEGVKGVEVEILPGLVKIEASAALTQTVSDVLYALGYPELGRVKGVKSVGAKAKSFVSCAVGRMSDEVAEKQEETKQ